MRLDDSLISSPIPIPDLCLNTNSLPVTATIFMSRLIFLGLMSLKYVSLDSVFVRSNVDVCLINKPPLDT